MYSKTDIDRVNAAAHVEDFLQGVHAKPGKSQRTRYAKCPACGKEDGMQITRKTGGSVCHCFHCDTGIYSPVDAVMKVQGKTFPEALKTVAEHIGYDLKHEQTGTERKPVKRTTRANAREKKEWFYQRQLRESGLEEADVMARVMINGEEVTLSPFTRGGYDVQTWEFNHTDDEMLIFYYGLEGQPVTFPARGAAGRPREYVRVRWSNPSIHLNSKGKPIKYQTPPKATAKLYIPQRIREAYRSRTRIETLVVQEGEKKAEKACKHGMLSVGIQGIHNIGNKDTGIIQELQYLIQACQVKRVVLLFDADWDRLSDSLAVNDAVDYRPRSFASATRKFRDYVESMRNVDVNVDVYFAHINTNENGDKGVDDLLTNTLKGREEELEADFRRAMVAHDGRGTWVDVHKISSMSDWQIDEFWHIRNPEAFYKAHRQRLETLGRFRINRISYVVEEGQLKVLTRYDSEHELWTIDYTENGKRKVDFVNREMLRFIAANNFFRIRTVDCEDDEYRFIHIEDGIIKFSGINEIRNFVYHYLEDNCREEDVKEHYSAKVEYIISNARMSLLKMVEDNYEQFLPEVQHFYYEDGKGGVKGINVTAQGVEEADTHSEVWQDKVIRRTFRRTPIFRSVQHNADTGEFTVELTPEGRNCEFLQFLDNTCNFQSATPRERWTAEQRAAHAQNLVNKLTTIGYLLNDYKYQSELKAVVAMDGQLSEIGQSNGRTGKSLIGVALKQMVEQTTIDGRNTKNDDDFIYSEVTPRTRNIWIDDVKVNFDFERFYFAITGDLKVNPKGQGRFEIKNARSPKFYITTNHAINAFNSSSKDRIIYMSFSDWYNDTHKPIDEFGHSFFSEWDDTQWNLFDNLMAECNMLYRRAMEQAWTRPGEGAVPPPMEDIIRRTLLQQVGSAFCLWADIYFDPSNKNLNTRVARKAMYDAYHSEFPDSKYGVTPNNFRSRLEFYCQYKGYDMNPRKQNKRGVSFWDFISNNKTDVFLGARDVSGGVEYFEICSREYARTI